GYNYYGNSPRDRLDGTSFAAPVVAAAAAIAKQRDKNIDAGAFLEALKHTSRDAGPQGYDVAYGYGILDIGNLVQYLQTSQVNVYFNANGGSVKTNSKTAWPGGKYGTLPTPTKNKKGFSGWYTSKKGGKKVTPDTIVSGNVTLYAHWQGGTTLSDMTASKGKLSPVFSHSKMHYKLTLMKGDATTRITAVKSSGSTSVKIKVGDGGYKTKSSVKVKLKKGGKTTVYIKVSKKGMKAKTYKIVVRRKK
ncbi:MAG: InlB B-repeat-containing protein, partial [Clostridiales Family XIII bacterium]|nr:InlB B-repeat-containing protein [Clostridiales Family XIII bacterium]